MPVRSISRPVLCVLLVVLLTTWGTCPCIFAKMLRGATGVSTSSATCAVGEVNSSASSGLPPCCCRGKQGADTDSGDASRSDSREPGNEDCPCCKHGGWMRDLPPPAHATLLDMPDVGAPDWPALAVETLVLTAVRRPIAADTGPPGAWRPHAAPVGIVRLQL
jgi:hypothetical protein